MRCHRKVRIKVQEKGAGAGGAGGACAPCLLLHEYA